MKRELKSSKRHVQDHVKLQPVEVQTVSLQNINQLHSVQQVQHQLLEVIQASGHGHVLNLMVLKTVALLRFLSKLVAVDLVIISIIMH